MMQLDAYHSNDNSEHGYSYSLTLAADGDSYKVMESVYHNKEEYQDDNEQTFDNIEDAFKAYSQLAMYSQYHGKFFDLAARRKEVMRTLRLVNTPEVKDDLADMTPEEIVSQSSETIYTEPQVLMSNDDTALVHPAVADTLKALRGELDEKVAEKDAQIKQLEMDLHVLRAAREDMENQMANIDVLLSIKVGKVEETVEDFALSSSEPEKLYTVKELSEMIGIAPRCIYEAKDKGQLECTQRGKKCGVRFTEEQVDKAREYFGGEV